MADHLARTALKLFARKGYTATSVNEIVEAAGVTKPMLYYYFKSKEQLARHLVIEPLESLLQAMTEADKQTENPFESQTRWLGLQIHFSRIDPDRARFVFALYFGPLGADLADAVGSFGLRARQLLYAIVSRRFETLQLSDSRLEAYIRAINGQMVSTVIDILYNPDSPLWHEPAESLARRLIVDLDNGYLQQPLTT
ncbi:MAG: TetR/AcrR family transcriptional regulator [bacterium]